MYERYEELEKAKNSILIIPPEDAESYFSRWGHEDIIITEEMIQALKDGKIVIFTDGEYSHSLIYKPPTPDNP